MGTLYIVATPIGNLGDISARALETLKRVQLIAAEDTRHTGRLLAHFGIETPLISYHSFNERSRRDRLLNALAEGDVALVSDAGTPGISDPGQALVADAVAAGYSASPIPGPSSLVAAASVSGLVDGPMIFLGFPPRQSSERRRLFTRAGSAGFALVLFESPNRLGATLKELQTLIGERQAAVMRELTKLHEESRFGTLSSLAADLETDGVRGECVIVVAASSSESESPEDPVEVVERLLATGMKPSEAAREAAAITGRPRSEVYALIGSKGKRSPDQSG